MRLMCSVLLQLVWCYAVVERRLTGLFVCFSSQSQHQTWHHWQYHNLLTSSTAASTSVPFTYLLIYLI